MLRYLKKDKYPSDLFLPFRIYNILQICKIEQIDNLAKYAKKIETDMYEVANEISEYYNLFLESVKFHGRFINDTIYKPKPKMKSLQLLIDTLTNGLNIPIGEQQQKVMSILKANPDLMAAFLNQRWKNQQHPQKIDTLRQETSSWGLLRHESCPQINLYTKMDSSIV